MKRKFRVYALALLPLLMMGIIMTGCTGGEFAEPQPSPTVDPPKITDVSPSEAYVGDSITILGENFGDSADAGKITFNGIAVTEIESWADGKIICKYPDYTNTGAVIVTVNNLESNSDRFVTRLRKWRTPERNNTGNDNILGYSGLAADSSNNVLSYFVQSDGTYDRAYVNMFRADKGRTKAWQGPQTVDNGSVEDVEWINAAFDPSGNAFVVFSQDTRSYVVRYDADSGTWGSPTVVDHGDQSVWPSVAFDPSGNAICVFIGSDGSGYARIYANYYNASSDSWKGAEIIDNVEDDAVEAPKIAFDGSGNAVCLYNQTDGGVIRVFANRYSSSSGTWQGPEIVDGGAFFNLTPSLSVSPSGDALISYTRPDFTVWVNRYDSSTNSWEGASSLDLAGNDGMMYAVIAVDSSGNGFCIAQVDDGTYARTMACRYNAATGKWSAAEFIDTGAGNDSQEGVVSFDSSGNAMAAFSQSDGVNDRIYVNRWDVDSAKWTGPVAVDGDSAYNNASPQILFNAAGSAICSFQREVTGTYSNLFVNMYR